MSKSMYFSKLSLLSLVALSMGLKAELPLPQDYISVDASDAEISFIERNAHIHFAYIPSVQLQSIIALKRVLAQSEITPALSALFKYIDAGYKTAPVGIILPGIKDSIVALKKHQASFDKLYSAVESALVDYKDSVIAGEVTVSLEEEESATVTRRRKKCCCRPHSCRPKHCNNCNNNCHSCHNRINNCGSCNK